LGIVTINKEATWQLLDFKELLLSFEAQTVVPFDIYLVTF